MQTVWNLSRKVVAAVVAACCWYHYQSTAAVITESLQNDHYLSSKFDSSKSCDDLYWLHAPKTSSTFCTTISHICCPSRFDLGVKSLKQNEPYKSRLQLGCSLPANLRQQGLACVGNLLTLSKPPLVPLYPDVTQILTHVNI